MTTPRSFAAASAITGGPADYQVEIPTGWGQGRSVFGGVIAGAMMRAMCAELSDPNRPPRGMDAALCGAVVPGPATISVETVRSGSRLSLLTARVLQDGQVVATAQATVAADRSPDGDFDHVTLPPVAAAETIPPVPQGIMPPEFTRNYEFRMAHGHAPIAGAQHAVVGGWIRARVPEPVDTAAALGLADTWYPALYATLKAPRPIATVSWSCHLHRRLPLDVPDDAFWLITKESTITVDGYSSETDLLYAPDGRLVATASQLIALIR